MLSPTPCWALSGIPRWLVHESLFRGFQEDSLFISSLSALIADSSQRSAPEPSFFTLTLSLAILLLLALNTTYISDSTYVSHWAFLQDFSPIVLLSQLSPSYSYHNSKLIMLIAFLTTSCDVRCDVTVLSSTHLMIQKSEVFSPVFWVGHSSLQSGGV